MTNITALQKTFFDLNSRTKSEYLKLTRPRHWLNYMVDIISTSSSLTNSMVAFFKRRLLLKASMREAVKEQSAITPVMGNEVPFCRTLTTADIIAPMLIWMKPINAEALPALCAKGAIESADALGKMKPWQQKNTKMSVTVEYNSFI